MSKQRLVEVDDGLRLAIRYEGSGSPAVVCLSCAGGAHEEWSAVVERVHPLTQVITYGRPSLGGSDALPAHLAGRFQTLRWAATQLRTLLHNAGIMPPYLLLTSSVGSWIADQYAAIWPDEITGMVLIDPTMVSSWPEIAEEDPLVDGDDDEPGCIRLDWKECYAEMARSIPPPRQRRVVVSGSDGRWERDSSPSAWHQPLTLPEVDQRWQAAQQEWAHRISAVHVVADTAGHFVHRDQPDLIAYVTAAILTSAGGGTPVDLATGVAAQGGQIRS